MIHKGKAKKSETVGSMHPFVSTYPLIFVDMPGSYLTYAIRAIWQSQVENNISVGGVIEIQTAITKDCQ